MSRQGLRRTFGAAVISLLVLVSGLTGIKHVHQQRSEPVSAPTPPDGDPVPAPTVSPAVAEAVAAESARKNQTPVTPAPPPETARGSEPELAPEPAPPPPPPAQTTEGQHLKRIPVLMYHEIGEKPNNNYIRRGEFEAQMKWLKENGYTAVTLGEAYRNLKEGKPIPLKPVAVTFDDGYVTFYTIAAPVLKAYGFRATNFIITGLVGLREQMNWAQVEELAALGFEMGAHSMSHPDLRSLTGDALRRQLVGSKQELEKHIGRTVEFFAYPAGRYNQETQAAVRAAGFLAAVTTEHGTVTPDSETTRWARVRISRGETEAGFASKIKSASESERP